jgi:hypothetical protein
MKPLSRPSARPWRGPGGRGAGRAGRARRRGAGAAGEGGAARVTAAPRRPPSGARRIPCVLCRTKSGFDRPAARADGGGPLALRSSAARGCSFAGPLLPRPHRRAPQPRSSAVGTLTPTFCHRRRHTAPALTRRGRLESARAPCRAAAGAAAATRAVGSGWKRAGRGAGPGRAPSARRGRGDDRRPRPPRCDRCCAAPRPLRPPARAAVPRGAASTAVRPRRGPPHAGRRGRRERAARRRAAAGPARAGAPAAGPGRSAAARRHGDPGALHAEPG